MALPVNIHDLVTQRKVERSRIEYKSSWNPETALHTITAFANDFDNMGGGYILIGIEEENGVPKFPINGLNSDEIDKIHKDIFNKCNLIEPRYIPVMDVCEFEDNEIIVLWVPGGEERPYRCPDKVYSKKGAKSNKSYYIRKGSITLKANAREEQELISMARDVPFDDSINYHANIEDMKPVLISDYLHSVGSELYDRSLNRPVEEVATDMQLVRGPTEYRKPINVGLMFFNERPDRFFPYAQIEVIDKPDATGIGMTEKIFNGPLNKQITDALSYIKNYIIKEYVTKVPDNERALRAFNWPFQAVEEALCNAVYHKSYQIHEPITVTITPKKMEILSLPGPDRSITDEQLQECVLVSRRYRNRRIGNFLKELEIVEGRNTGVPLILRSMKNNGSDLPVFETDEDRTYFLTILPIHPFFTNGYNHNTNGKRKNRDEIKNLIVKALQEKEQLSMNEIAFTLGYKKLNDTVRDVIGEMLKAGDLKYLYPDIPKCRNQKLLLAVGK